MIKLNEDDVGYWFIDGEGTILKFNIILNFKDSFNLEFAIYGSNSKRLYNYRGNRYVGGKKYSLIKKLSKEENPEYYL